MADFCFAASAVLPEEIGCSGGKILSVSRGETPQPINICQEGHVIFVVLSQTENVISLKRAMQRRGAAFLDDVPQAAGFIWHLITGEWIVFRDVFGFTPIMGCLSRDDHRTLMSITTDPLAQAKLTSGYAFNRAWFYRFLTMQDDFGDEDIYQSTSRIVPGETRFHCFGDPASCIRRMLSGTAPEKTALPQTISNQYWARRRYVRLEAGEEELAEGLRQQLIAAADRIPDEHPYFTLSGGLDSTGILAAYSRHHAPDKGGFEAYSLISKRYPRCDESAQLDVLETAFPLRLRRDCMDESYALSEPGICSAFRAYGPIGAPGMDAMLYSPRKIREIGGVRTIITGNGGNLLVKVRLEALMRDRLEAGDFSGFIQECMHMSRGARRYLSRRIAGNLFGGRLHACCRSKQASPQNQPESYFHPMLATQFPEALTDPFFFCSHREERARIMQSYDWEYWVRYLDTKARLCGMKFYDPLFDPALYDYCAQIPPRAFLKNGTYRALYKKALSAWLPAAIIDHPKVQNFNDNIVPGMTQFAAPVVRRAIDQLSGFGASVLDKQRLLSAYEAFCARPHPHDILPMWRAISLCLWNAR